MTHRNTMRLKIALETHIDELTGEIFEQARYTKHTQHQLLGSKRRGKGTDTDDQKFHTLRLVFLLSRRNLVALDSDTEEVKQNCETPRNDGIKQSTVPLAGPHDTRFHRRGPTL